MNRRSFLHSAGATAFVCALGGGGPQTRSEVARADAAARTLKRPKPIASDPVDALTFDTPQPQPGGQAREYWLQAESFMWDPVPTGRDEWMKMPIPARRRFRALGYRPYSEGFAEPLGPAQMGGPLLQGEVGDTIVVHFRNAEEHFNQAFTFHPHGVRYTPDYDGAYLGPFTRAGGFIAPGEEFKYTFECTPDSVGAWAYHDHGPNHTVNIARGLFGGLVVREKGTPAPDVEELLVLHQLPPQITGVRRVFQCINGRAFAGNTPTIRAKVGQDVAMHVIGGDSMFHTFHVHGHRWRNGDGQTDNPTLGPSETITARWREDNAGRWLYHCHVFTHQDAGMAGWYLVEP